MTTQAVTAAPQGLRAQAKEIKNLKNKGFYVNALGLVGLFECINSKLTHTIGKCSSKIRKVVTEAGIINKPIGVADMSLSFDGEQFIIITVIVREYKGGNIDSDVELVERTNSPQLEIDLQSGTATTKTTIPVIDRAPTPPTDMSTYVYMVDILGLQKEFDACKGSITNLDLDEFVDQIQLVMKKVMDRDIYKSMYSSASFNPTVGYGIHPGIYTGSLSLREFPGRHLDVGKPELSRQAVDRSDANNKPVLFSKSYLKVGNEVISAPIIVNYPSFLNVRSTDSELKKCGGTMPWNFVLAIFAKVAIDGKCSEGSKFYTHYLKMFGF